MTFVKFRESKLWSMAPEQKSEGEINSTKKCSAHSNYQRLEARAEGWLVTWNKIPRCLCDWRCGAGYARIKQRSITHRHWKKQKWWQCVRVREIPNKPVSRIPCIRFHCGIKWATPLIATQEQELQHSNKTWCFLRMSQALTDSRSANISGLHSSFQHEEQR